PGLAAPYRVIFTRETARRPDVSIDARGGFKQVSAHRLHTITVKYQQQTVRSYELVYNENAYGSGGTDTTFGKTLLTAVVQKGAGENGQEFNRHAFEYFNAVGGDQNGGKLGMFGQKQEKIDAQRDSLVPTYMEADPLLSNFVGFPQTLVGGSLGVNAGFNGFFGIGPPLLGEDIHAAVTASGNVSYSHSNLALIDIDGDGLADKVFEHDGVVYYRKNLTDPVTGIVRFKAGDPDRVQGLSRLSDNQSVTWGLGVKGKANAANAYATTNHTTSTDSVYFSDVNGDGLVDQVNNRTVNFNRRGADGGFAFNAQTAGTPAPIGTGTINAAELLSAMAAERASMEAANPLMDAVRRWEAPYEGRIVISGDVQLHNFRTDSTLSDSERNRREQYERADGVRVSIQKGDTEIWAADIGGEEYTVKSAAITQGLQVKKGQAIYFRVHSKGDGNYDRVHWAPQVRYVNAAGEPLEQLDANQRNTYLYRGDADFVLAGRGVRMIATQYGTVRVIGQLQKSGVTSDDVTLVVEVSDGVEDAQGNVQRVVYPEKGYTETLRWNETGTIKLDHSMEVLKGQNISLRIASDSPIDLKQLQWIGEDSPRLYYTSAYEPEVHVKQPIKDKDQTVSAALPASADDVAPDKIDMPTDGGVLPRRELAVLNAKKQPIYQIVAAYDADIYSRDTAGSQPQAPWIAPKDGVVLFTPWVTL
ncbi:MAG: hypothetical protein OEY75_12725, partial [Hylemonella sp.]|nr:hypothetical protein [Hylemonella sp.]